ncbi:MAG TPA: histidine triad nucleotide-binding protein [Longimicrobiales bacterium]|nr:histidine triad nucleotide-binding protein [Longimicrobiales bacterium]
MEQDDCVFCRIAAGSTDAAILHRDAGAVAFRDIAPKAPVHVLVIPTRHIPSVDATGPADEATLGHLIAVARDIARSEELADDGYRLVMNNGAAAGQSVDHLHLHLLGGRELGWPPG